MNTCSNIGGAFEISLILRTKHSVVTSSWWLDSDFSSGSESLFSGIFSKLYVVVIASDLFIISTISKRDRTPWVSNKLEDLCLGRQSNLVDADLQIHTRYTFKSIL